MNIFQFVITVQDYDEAISFYTEKMGFRLIEDTPLGGEKRWVRVSPSSAGTPAILLARAVTDAQRATVGNQTGGRVFVFLHTDDIRRDHADMTRRGVQFVSPLREEEYGTVAVFQDLYGNKFDLIQPHKPEA